MNQEFQTKMQQEFIETREEELRVKISKEPREQMSVSMKDEIQQKVFQTLQSMGVSNYNPPLDASPRATMHVSTKGSNCAADIGEHEPEPPRENFLEKLKSLDKDRYLVDFEHCPGVPSWAAVERRDVDEIMDGTQWLSSKVLSFWCTYLHRLCVAKGTSDLFGFFDPTKIISSNYSLPPEQVQAYMENKIRSEPKMCYLGAYLHSDHWQVFILKPRDNIVVWLCSLHFQPNPVIKGIIERIYGREPIWMELMGPRQKNGWTCGYYVMKNVLTIVTGDIVDGWEQIFNNISEYGQDVIDHIRHTWAEFLFQMIEEKEKKTKAETKRSAAR